MLRSTRNSAVLCFLFNYESKIILFSEKYFFNKCLMIIYKATEKEQENVDDMLVSLLVIALLAMFYVVVYVLK